MEERVQQLEKDMSKLSSLAVQAISESKSATGAMHRLADKLEVVADHMIRSQEQHKASRDKIDKLEVKTDEHSKKITELQIATGRSDVMTGALWSVWLKVGGSVAVAGVVGGLAAKAAGVI